MEAVRRLADDEDIEPRRPVLRQALEPGQALRRGGDEGLLRREDPRGADRDDAVDVVGREGEQQRAAEER